MTQNNYWIGVFDVRVPNDVNVIYSKDGHNLIYKPQTQYLTEDDLFPETKMNLGPDMTEDQYKQKFCTLHNNGNYYYNSNSHPFVKFMIPGSIFERSTYFNFR